MLANLIDIALQRLHNFLHPTRITRVTLMYKTETL